MSCSPSEEANTVTLNTGAQCLHVCRAVGPIEGIRPRMLQASVESRGLVPYKAFMHMCTHTHIHMRNASLVEKTNSA